MLVIHGAVIADVPLQDWTATDGCVKAMPRQGDDALAGCVQLRRVAA